MCGSIAEQALPSYRGRRQTFPPITQTPTVSLLRNSRVCLLQSTHTDCPVRGLLLLVCVCVLGGVRIGGSWWVHCRCDFVIMSGCVWSTRGAGCCCATKLRRNNPPTHSTHTPCCGLVAYYLVYTSRAVSAVEQCQSDAVRDFSISSKIIFGILSRYSYRWLACAYFRVRTVVGTVSGLVHTIPTCTDVPI